MATAATVSEQLHQAGDTMRRGALLIRSTQQILELRDQGLTWNEVAKQVDMTVSGAWSRYRKARQPRPSWSPDTGDAEQLGKPGNQ